MVMRIDSAENVEHRWKVHFSALFSVLNGSDNSDIFFVIY